MGLFDNVLKENVLTGLAIGVGVAILAPTVLPAAAKAAKPLLKAALKAGIVMFEKGKETAAELGEVFEDIVAEAKAEMAEGHNNVAPVSSVAAVSEGEAGA